jgi:ATP diphosphatase
MADASNPLIHDPKGGMPRLLEIMRCLRDPDTGCPWDIEQTFETIAPYTIEEAYEVADAIERKNWTDLEGELGDLLLQVVYFAQMGTEEEKFTFDSIANAISDKMVDRHPHVFGDSSPNKSAEQQTRDWETQKAKERATRGETRVLDGVAMGLPALTRALKLQKRASRVGFDWGNTKDVLDKIVEEAHEVTEAAATADLDKIEDEIGDLLFVVANLARHLNISPEDALRRTNAKFIRRFNHIEDTLHANGRSPAEASLEEMDSLWDAAKELGK